MIVLLAREGQTCNQLLSLAGLYALGKKSGEKVICPVMDESLKKYFAFKHQSDEEDTQIVMKSSVVGQILRKVIRTSKRIIQRITKKKVTEVGRRVRLLFDWFSFVEQETLVQNSESIREYFAINPVYANVCAGEIKRMHKQYDILVGVHIRRGDYKTFNNGIWYYDDARYIEWLKHFQDTCKDRKIAFVLCSNEKVNIDEYKEQGLEVFQIGKSAIEDICYLSMCDYVVGPPSTFSFWAAFYGNKQRCILDNGCTQYEWSDFKFYEQRVEAGEPLR